MAEVVLIGASRMMISGAKNAVFELVKLRWIFDDKVQELQLFLRMIEAFLYDAETKSTNPPVMEWLRWLADGASRAQDVLAELAYEAKRIELRVNNRWGGKLINSFSSHNPTIFRLRMAYKVKSVTKSLDKICSKGTGLGLQNRGQLVSAPASSSRLQETHAFLGDPELVVPREVAVSEVVNRLISSSNTSRRLGVVSIVGMAGFRKTTLAKMVLEDERVNNLFDKRQQLWVCVSETFNDKVILIKMLGCFTCDPIASFESLNLQGLVMKLKKELQEKTYLLVLDDVWNKDTKEWDSLMECLRGINQKNKTTILATARDMEVASTMGSLPEFIYEVPILEDDQCWSIIKAKSFGISSEIPCNLEIIGRSIAEKCKGVALVASVIGGTMRKDRTERGWSSIQNSDLWNSLESNEDILRILRLSYDHLGSPYLKLCFVFCSLFPEDSLLFREELIQLWIAAGFLHPSLADHCNTAWDTGDKYFKDLVSNSLFQDVEMDFYGNIKTCKMHDLVHSLARSLLGAAILTTDTSSSRDVSFIRRLNIIGEKSNLAYRLAKVDAPNLRSLFSNFDVFCHMSKKCRRLRTLKLYKATGADKLPESIKELKHLKYFDISGTQIESLPRSFTELLNLQTLRVTGCENLKELPKHMENLVELSHLYIDKESLMPINIGRLTSLQTLPLFFVVAERGCGIEELGSLSHLQGKLEIRRLERVRRKEDARMAKLQEKQGIWELEFEWSNERADVRQDEDVLEELQPHSKLKGLRIRNYGGCNFPSWLPSTSLTMLKLDSCSNCVKLPSLGHLPNLTYLCIKGLSGVKLIDADFYGNGNFSALKEFKLKDMRSLEEWFDATRRDLFPSLEKLSICRCGNLRSIQLTNELCPVTHLKLDSCSKCVKLPSLGHLPNLTHLFINGLSGVKLIDADFYGNGNFPALKEFELWDMESLEEWFDATRRDLFPSLEKLTLCDCHKLRSIQLTNDLPCLKTLTCRSLGVSHIPPGLFSSKCLRELGIYFCNKLKLTSGLQHCTSLQSLVLRGCYEMSSELECLGSLKNLVELEIHGCNNIVWDKIPETSLGCLTHLKRSSFDFGYLPFNFGCSYKAPELPPCFTSIHHLHGSLIELKLFGGPNIKSLPHQMQELTNLQELEVNSFGGLETLPQWFGNLSSLEKLQIDDCTKLRNLSPLKAMRSLTHLTLEFGEEIPQYFDSIHQSMPSSLKELTLWGFGCSTLPPQIQHLTTLEVLEINHFDAIEDLPEWLGNLSSLQRLDIECCGRLSKLPSQQSMLRLSNLKSIRIFACGNMSRICVEGSIEWSKISHIPDILIV